MKRKIIKIDEEKCNGCGLCAKSCPEGAIQMINGKAKLVGEILCDGLGACIGNCPQDAITIEERNAAQYDEVAVLKNILKQDKAVLAAHLEHLKSHGQKEYLMQALKYLKKHKIDIPVEKNAAAKPCGCPGSKILSFADNTQSDTENGQRHSQLRQWPVQLHLVSPQAPYFQNKDVLLVADCVAYALADFHKDYLKGKSLAIACPKLDSGKEEYIEKLTALIDDAKIKTLTVMIMEVPCCGGLLHLAKQALNNATNKISLKCITVSLHGETLKETDE